MSRTLPALVVFITAVLLPQRLPGAPSPRTPEGFEVTRSRHFALHHADPELADRLAGEAEAHLLRVRGALQADPPRRRRFKRFHIYLYRNRQEYEDYVPTEARDGAAAAVSRTEVVATADVSSRLLLHEITHLVVHTLYPSSPAWVQEGFATGGYERAGTKVYRRFLRSAGKSKKAVVPVRGLLTAHSIAASRLPLPEFYVRARVVLEFLHFAAGDRAAFDKLYHTGHAEMERRLRRFARKQRGTTKVRKSDWLADVLAESIADHYGYESFAALEKDVTRYARHRARETRAQSANARRKPREFRHPEILARRHDSDHFVLFTTASDPTASDALRLAEAVYDAFAREFWDCKVLMPARVRILLFEKRQEFLTYRNIDVGKGMILPHFSNGTATVIREGLTRDYFAQTLAHEVAHGLSDWILDAPPWLSEGVAYYVWQSVHSKTKTVQLGEVHETKRSRSGSFLKLAEKADTLLSLRELLALEPTIQLTPAQAAHSWGLIHFLQEGRGSTGRATFHQLLSALAPGGKDAVDLLTEHLGPLERLEPEFRTHVQTLEISSRKR